MESRVKSFVSFVVENNLQSHQCNQPTNRDSSRYKQKPRTENPELHKQHALTTSKKNG